MAVHAGWLGVLVVALVALGASGCGGDETGSGGGGGSAGSAGVGGQGGALGGAGGGIDDETPPTTSASPVGGLFNGALQVTLDCEDDGGTGCAATHFTVDGSEPTTASSLYEAAIDVGGDTTLRFFSLDRAGNAEPSRTEIYAIDTVRPEVVSVTPAHEATGVPLTVAVEVEFSEPMDEATLSTATLSLTPGTAATVSYDDATHTATITPDSPLRYGVTYRVTVDTSVADPAGNTLAAAFESEFGTLAAALARVDDGGSATFGNAKFAYDAAGNGIAVWTAAPLVNHDDALYYALYTASTAAWSTEQPVADLLAPFELASNGTVLMLAAGGSDLETKTFAYDSGSSSWNIQAGTVIHDSLVSELALVSNGTTFCLAWKDSDGVTASIYDGNGWTETVLKAGGTGVSSLRLASDGGAYGAIWQEHFAVYGVSLAVHLASGWQAAERLDDPASVHSARGLQLAGADDGTGFAAVWLQGQPGDSQDRVFAAQYQRSGATGALVGRTLLTPTAAGNYEARLASAGSGYAAAWRRTDLHAAIHDGNVTWGAEQTVATASGALSSVSLAADAGRYAVVWKDSTAGLDDLWASVRFTSWNTPVQLNDASTQVAELFLASTPDPVTIGNNSFGVVFRQRAAGLADEIKANRYGTSWLGTSPRLDTAAWGVSSPAITGLSGGRYLLAWSQDDALVSRLSDAASAVALTTQQVESDASEPVLAINDAGEVLAVWDQGIGNGQQLFARIHRPGGWDAPVALSTPNRDFTGHSPQVASSGDTFMVVLDSALVGPDELRAYYYDGASWTAEETLTDTFSEWQLAAGAGGYLVTWDGPASTSGDSLYSRHHSAGSWGAPEEFLTVTSTEAIFLAGHAGGYVAGISDDTDVYGAFHDGSGWGSPATIANLGPGNFEVVSNGSDYAVAYHEDGGTGPHVWAQISTGTSWGAPVQVSTSEVDSGADIRLVSNGSGFAVGYGGIASNEFYAAIFDAGSWAAPLQLTDGSYSVGDMKLAANGSGFIAVYNDIDQYALYARRWSSGGWIAEDTLASSLYSDASWFAVAGQGTDFSVAWFNDYSAGATGAFFRSFDGSGWSAVAHPFDVDRVQQPWLGYNGLSRTLLWRQPSPSDWQVNSLWSYPEF